MGNGAPANQTYPHFPPTHHTALMGTRPMHQKVFPHPTVRAPSASNSPSARAG